jgi:hypothetical protein
MTCSAHAQHDYSKYVFFPLYTQYEQCARVKMERACRAKYYMIGGCVFCRPDA